MANIDKINVNGTTYNIIDTTSGYITSANDVYWCTYGTTTSAEIETAISAGKCPMVTYNNYTYTLRYRNSSTNHRFVCNYGGKEYSVVCQSDTWMPNGTLTFLTSAPVTSVNTKTGAVSLTASDVGALPSSTSIPTKTSDLTNDNGFLTSSDLTAGVGIDITSNVFTNTGLEARLRRLDDTDLNSVLDSGTYYVVASSSTIATNCNFPNGTNGLLIVAMVSTTVCRQFYFRVGTVDNNDHYWYSRQINTSSGTYGEWVGIYNYKNLTFGTGINITNGVITNTIFNANLNQKNGIDLNTITEGGVYYVINGSTALNFPSGATGALVVIKDSGTYSRQIYYRHGTLNSADQYWYSRLVNSSTQEASDWVQFYNSKTLTGGTGIEIANGVINDQFVYKAGDTVTISTPSSAPICMGGYIGSSGKALNLTFSFGRGISATSISATTLRISAYSSTARLIAASATNDLITGSVYSCTMTLNAETSTVTVHIVKNNDTTFGTNATSITGALSSGTFVFS